MTSPTRETSVHHIYKECRFGRSDVDRLFALVIEGIPPGSVRISSQHHATLFTAGSLDDLISEITRANVPRPSDPWPNLSLDAHDPSGGRTVHVSIDSERTEVKFSGRDETWVRGQAARVRVLVASVGGWDAVEANSYTMKVLLRTLGRWARLAAAMMMLVALLHPLGPFGSLFTVAFGYFGVKVLVQWFSRRANRPVLLVNSEVPSGSWWSRMSMTDRIAFGTMALTGLGIVAAVAVGIGQIAAE